MSVDITGMSEDMREARGDTRYFRDQLNTARLMLDNIRSLVRDHHTCMHHPHLGCCACAVLKIIYVNQCDGCRAGVPVDENGNHHMGKGSYPDLMKCQKSVYQADNAWPKMANPPEDDPRK